MIITHLKLNHMTNPVGYNIKKAIISYTVEEAAGKYQTFGRVTVALTADMKTIKWDSGKVANLDNLAFELDMELKPQTRYYWRVESWSDAGEYAVSEPAYFETPKQDAWIGEWIAPVADKKIQVIFHKDIHVEKDIVSARLYMVALGVYEVYLNGRKVSDEYLLPGLCPYDTYIPFQTYELSLDQGMNSLDVMTGDGWYKGNYGLNISEENYGNILAMIAELHITYADDTMQIIVSDESWKAIESPIVKSGIYNGEVFDANLIHNKQTQEYKVKIITGFRPFAPENIKDMKSSSGIPAGSGISHKWPGEEQIAFCFDKDRLCPRVNPPIRVNEHIKPVDIIYTPTGETVIDMGQNMVGWLVFQCNAPKSSEIFMEFGEILQNGNFYRDNLRTAEASFKYISNGVRRIVRPHFTFYGFRYVKITGWESDIDINDFEGWVIYSEMEEIGFLETSDPLVNKLISNAKWGQRGNFLDVPTDCPQRDERYGWTGDAQIFSGTASYNMDTYAFYAKFGKDVFEEQKKLGGRVPDVVPVANYTGNCSTAWGEAATVIPWNVYLHTGDKTILEDQFLSMKGWVDYMKLEDDSAGGKRLWNTGFHYGDWLALDGPVEGGVFGATDPHMIANAYYYHSTMIVANSAGILGKAAEEAYYLELAEEIKEAFIKEYYSPTGRLCIDTMTAYVVVLYMGLVPDIAYERVKESLLARLKRNRYKLDTGFVGTPYLCRMLSEHGMNDIAYQILLNREYPGWLYEVLLGATTVWERWNSLLPDGTISGTEMNSMNHCAYGSILEWMYRYMVGIKPIDSQAGFREFLLEPKPNYQLGWAKGSLRTGNGIIRSEWYIHSTNRIEYKCQVPFGTKAYLTLPDVSIDHLSDELLRQDGIHIHKGKDDKAAYLELVSGKYEFCYTPDMEYKKHYSIHSSFEEMLTNPGTKKILDKYFFKEYDHIPFYGEKYTLEEMVNTPFSYLPHDIQAKMDKELRSL